MMLNASLIALLIGALSGVSELLALGIVLSGVVIFLKTTYRELAIGYLFVGVAVLGYVGAMSGVGYLGKIVGLLSVYILRDSVFEIFRKPSTLIGILLTILLCIAFYIYGPQTAVAADKLISVIYNSFIFLLLFGSLLFFSKTISYRNIALIIIWFVYCYVYAGVFFEIGKVGVNLSDFSGIRDSIYRLNAMQTIFVGDMAEDAAVLSYQTVGNYAALAFIFFAIHSFAFSISRFDIMVFVAAAIYLVYVSGSRQSSVIVLITLLSFSLVGWGGSRRLFFELAGCMFLAFAAYVFVGVTTNSELIDSIFQGDSVAAAMNRDANFDAAIELIGMKPILGHGFGGYYIPSLGTISGEYKLFPHNVFLELLCEMGLVGSLLFLISWVFSYKSALNGRDFSSILKIRINDSYSLVPVLVFYAVGLLMNESLERGIAFFILLGLYLNEARGYKNVK
jgi:O-antigen ligase